MGTQILKGKLWSMSHRYEVAGLGLEASSFTPKTVLFLYLRCFTSSSTWEHNNSYFLRLLPGAVRYQLSHCFWLLEFCSEREPMSSSHVVRTSWVQILALLFIALNIGHITQSLHASVLSSIDEHNNNTNIIWCHEDYLNSVLQVVSIQYVLMNSSTARLS